MNTLTKATKNQIKIDGVVVVNTTPHLINFSCGITIPKAERPARIIEGKPEACIWMQEGSDDCMDEMIVPLSSLGGIQEVKIREVVENLPDEKWEIYYIVSMPIALLLKGKRSDLLCPIVARDKAGKVVGASGLRRFE